jgi:gamma-glutamyl:cysteine ligase YbdK (ATP-grasp superfamily)
VIESIHGSIVNEFTFGGINVSKELQKHVIELVPSTPHTSLAEMERMLFDGLTRFHHATGGRYVMMGLGMHPFLTLDRTAWWDHEDIEIYDVYDRLFDLRQHGWLNIQALQVNVHYDNEAHMVAMFDRLRSLIPFLVAVTASSPMVEGRLTGVMDNRLLYYRDNQKRVPLICNNIVPERLESRKQHDDIIESIYGELRKIGGDELCHEWIDSRGVVLRYHRECLELKACDEQECLRSDMAVTAFVLSLLRADVELESDHDMLLDMNEAAIRNGTASCRPELLRLYDSAFNAATAEERSYLPLVRRRIEEGSLAEVIVRDIKDGANPHAVFKGLASCLKDNRPRWPA